MGVVFDMQRCSVGDGPGIRTSVFLKGCPLRCVWCHNPEGFDARPQLRFDARKCMACGECRAACPQGCRPAESLDLSDCRICGRCVAHCATGALTVCGTEMSSDDVIAYVLRDKPFFDVSGGGMTLTGGEPLMQAAFALALCRAANKADIDICVETSGMGDKAALLALAPYVSCFLYDIKESDPVRHLAYTGASNERILDNLRALNGVGARIVLRCPVIPGFNNREEHFAFIGQLADSLGGVSETHIEPYHPLGEGKRVSLRMPPVQPVSVPTDEQIGGWIKAVARHTRKPVRLP